MSDSKVRSRIISVLIVSLFLLNVYYFFGSSNPTERNTPVISELEAAATTKPPMELAVTEDLSASEASNDSAESESASDARIVSPSNSSSTAARIFANGVLRVGVKYDLKPFGYLDENSQVVGFDVDITKEFARRWLGDEDAVELIQVTSPDRISKLTAGEVDLVVAALAQKRNTDSAIDFSQTYFLDGQSLLVHQDSEVSTLADLDNKTVAFIQGSSAIDQIQIEADRINLDIAVESYEAYPQALEALAAGEVDALTADSVTLSLFAEDNPGLQIAGGRLTQEPYSIGLPQGDSDFREFVDITLQEMKKDGTYDEIYKKWFPADQPYSIEIVRGEAPYATLSDFPRDIGRPTASRVEDILAKGVLRAGVGHDTQPFGYQDNNGRIVGFDVDIVHEFARRWLGDENAVELIPVTASDRIIKLAVEEVDLVAASMAQRRDISSEIDFSQTYFMDGQSLLVREGTGFGNLLDLDNKKVAVVEGSNSIDQLEEFVTEHRLAIETVLFQDHAQGLAALVAGDVDALTADKVTLLQFTQDYPGLQLVEGLLTQDPYGIGIPNNDFELRELVNFTLQEMKKDGTYDRIYRKWLTADEPYALQIVPGDADYLLRPYAGEGVTLTVNDESTIQRIRDRGTLLAGVKFDFKPFGFLNENNQLVGFDVDLIEAMAEEWGVEVEFLQVTSANRIPKLAAGEVDLVAASMTHKKERDETIDFSQTYFLDGQSLLVRRDSGLESIEDLDNKIVAAIEGSTSIDQIQAQADANDVLIEVLPFQEYPQALEALKNGQVDTLTTDSVALSQFSQDNPELVVVGGLFTEEPYGLGLPPGDSYFNNLVNFTLQKLKADGTYDRLYRTWFGEDSSPYGVEVLPGEWPYRFANSPTILDKPVQSKVDQIFDEGKFVAGVKFDFKPFGFLEEGELVGFDIDIMKEFAKRWLGDENALEFVQVTSANRIPKLAAGEVDIVAASMTHKKERDETIDFSQTYFLDGQSLLVRRNSDIEGIEDLADKSVAAIQGSTSIDQIQERAQAAGINIDVLPFGEYPQALTALTQGQVDALTTDSVALSQFAQDNPELEVVGDRFTQEPYGLGLPNYDDRFQDLVNFTLQEMKKDGTYDRLYEKWFGADTPYDLEIWPGEGYLDVNMVPMLRIEAGEFIRGSSDGFPNEVPQNTIYLDEFYIDQFEVTNRLYEQCVRAARCDLPRLTRSVNFAEYYANSDFGNHPIVWITWGDAQAYCEFAGKRLPTEAEWEKAARGPNGSIYPWGGAEPTTELANYQYAVQDVLPVGSYPEGVSYYGVHDMAGNVREWVADWYQRDYYTTAPDRNPLGPPTGVTKVLRGGAWNEETLTLKTTTRKDYLPESFDSNLGFRCVSSTFPPSR